jgi:hypothetical protein
MKSVKAYQYVLNGQTAVLTAKLPEADQALGGMAFCAEDRNATSSG